MKIILLSELPINSSFPWEDNGYSSNYIYTVNNSSDQQTICFNLQLKKLENRFVKHWTNDKQDNANYNQLTIEQHSYAALIGKHIVGVIICQEKKWNNTLYIEHLIIAESKRNKGIGSLLIKKVIEYSSAKNYRLIELETQNTNVPAITFYQKQGFKITGLNLMLYDPNLNLDEIAIFMTYNLKNSIEAKKDT